MLPKGSCGIIKGFSMMSLFSTRYYGQTPDSTAFVRHPSHRPPPVVRYDDQRHAPLALPDGLAGSSGALRGRACGHRLSQLQYRRAGAQALSPGWARGHSASQSAWDGSHGDTRVESRTPAGDRSRPPYGRRPECQLDTRLVSYVSG